LILNELEELGFGDIGRNPRDLWGYSHGSAILRESNTSTRCGNHHNILPLFGGLDGSLTFSPLLSYTMKHTHTSQKGTIDRGGRGMDEFFPLHQPLGSYL
jgi:hypothetical protein